jgi:pilus assembly protein CpaF
VNRRVFVVVGAKGGCGATTIAFGLAKQLASAVLVDGDLGGRRSHAVSFDVIAELDQNRIPGSPAFARSRDAAILELTNSYEDGFIVKNDAVETTLASLPSDAVVIVDAPQPFAAALRPFTTRAARFLVVVEPTLLGVSATKQMLIAMGRFGIPPSRIVLVVNSRESAYEMKPHEIADTLGVKVIGDLPPRRDRSYDKALSALASELKRLPDQEPIFDLRPSASTPIGDRRASPRNGVAPRNGVVVALPLHAGTNGTAVQEPVKHEDVKAEIHAAMMSRIDFAAAARMYTNAQKMAELRAQVNDLASELVAGRRDLGSVEEASRIKQEVIEEALGLGPIEAFMHDPTVTEVMVNGVREVYVERNGRIELTPKRFVDDRQIRLIIERVLAPLGRRIDESTPMVDARLPDGSRVNATIEPLSIDGPTLTIRRFGTHRLGIDDLIRIGAMTPGVTDFLRAAVRARLNIAISGGTGAGKTTMLGALSSFIPPTERIVTIEDAAELSLAQPHVVRLEARPANLEGRGEIRIRDCVRNALRMRPDRIVVGECRGGEALDMLQAMNTGHDGSLTTIHANSPRDALSRIETMVLMAGFDLPIRAIREQISAAIDIVMQVSRMSDGSRRMMSLCEVVGMEGEVVTMHELARYRQRGIDAQGNVVGAFEATGVQPMCLGRFGEMGIDFDPSALGPAPAMAMAWSAR